MADIPPTKSTDPEDVVWGLQTADTLWRRGERIDALVWLRRAAQAAGDANDDDRALELARFAAELTELTDAEGSAADEASEELADDDLLVDDVSDDVANPTPLRPPPPDDDESSGPSLEASESEVDTDDLGLPHGELEPAMRQPMPSVPDAARLHAGILDPWAEMSSKLPVPEPHVPPTRESDEEVVTSVRPNALKRSEEPPASVRMPISQPPPALNPPARTSRPSFGSMKAVAPPSSPLPSIPSSPLSGKPPSSPSLGPPKPPPPLPPRARPPLPKPSAPVARVAPPPVVEEAISVTPDEPSLPPPPVVEEPAAAPEPVEEPVVAAAPEPPQYEPPLVDEDQLAAAPEPPQYEPPLIEDEPVAPEPPQYEPPLIEDEPVAPEPPQYEPPLIDEDQLAAAAPELEPPHYEPEPQLEPAYQPEPEPQPEALGAAIPSIPPARMLDLEQVEAFSDLPDDAREAFAAAATLHDLNEGEEVATFALAYIVEGSFEVAATMVDASAGRLDKGAVLRSRGTTSEGVPMRLIAVKGSGIVATWSDASVTDAFRTIPWVEDDLRAAADRMMTLVGITIGPLGERLDIALREQVVSKLKMRPLLPQEIIVNKGETVPILLVGIGELELLRGDEVAGIVSSGEFLFPTEVLGMGDAPMTARAGKGGALVMLGDRGVAQELLVTCPPLLEVFAGM